MINQIVKNVACRTSHQLPDLTSVIDGSFKLRLRNMRLQKASQNKIAVTNDNQLYFRLRKTLNFPRVKHANRIGVNYWASAKYDMNRTITPVSYYTLLDGAFRTLQQQAAILDGHLEAPQTAWGQEIDCLNEFVAGTSRQKIVGQYTQLPDGSREITQFPKTNLFRSESNSWKPYENPHVDELFAATSQATEQRQPKQETNWAGQVDEKSSAAPKVKKPRSKKSTDKASTKVQTAQSTQTLPAVRPKSTSVPNISKDSDRRNSSKSTSKQKELVTA